jgi:hypothetical protein
LRSIKVARHRTDGACRGGVASVPTLILKIDEGDPAKLAAPTLVTLAWYASPSSKTNRNIRLSKGLTPLSGMRRPCALRHLRNITHPGDRPRGA